MKTRKHSIIYALLNNRFDNRLTRRLQTWLYRNRDDRELDKALLDSWNGIDALADSSTAVSLIEVRQRIAKPAAGRRRLLLKWGSVAASVMVAALFVFTIGLYQRSLDLATINAIEYIVPPGEIRQLELPDGSKVSLNAGSVLIYPDKFSGGNRSVYLSGEGFFEVVTNPEKPFIVKTAHMDVTAKGTTFNVNSYPGSRKVAATLNSGKIEVECLTENNQYKHVVSPGQQVEYDSNTGDLVRRTVDAGEVSSWRDGSLVFNNISLAQIIPALERRFGIHIRVNADVDQEECYTLKFQHDENLEYIVSILAQAAGDYSYSIMENYINLYSTGTQPDIREGGDRER